MRARHVGVDQDGGGEAAEGGAAQLLGEDNRGQRPHGRAAMGFGMAHAEQAELAHLQENLARHHAGRLPGFAVRNDLALDEAPHLLAQHAQLVGHEHRVGQAELVIRHLALRRSHVHVDPPGIR